MELLRKPNLGKHETLFPLKGEFHIAELGRDDALVWNDNVRNLKQLIVESEDMYPGIDRWFKDKVIPGLKASERIAYVAYENDKPIASAVLKIGRRSKLCHLKIHKDFQDLYLGQMFFTQMAIEILHRSKELYFTLPESLWCQRGEFFESFGFSSPTRASRQYRSNDAELLCAAPLARVWSSILQKLPKLLKRFSVGGHSSEGDVLLSVKPKYARQILSGEKSVEIRKKFSSNWIGSKVVLYASRPTSALVGEATVSSITRGRPTDVWSQFGSRIGCSWQEYNAYAASSTEVSAIEFENVSAYESPFERSEASALLGKNLVAPQSYCKLSSDKDWGGAVSVATLLRGRIHGGRRVSVKTSE